MFVGSSGMLSMIASGAVRSMVQPKLAGVGSMLPAASLARALKLWLPSVRPEWAAGLKQGAKAPPSRLHSKVRLAGAVTLSVPENVNVAVVPLVGLAGPLSTVVSGGVASTTFIR